MLFVSTSAVYLGLGLLVLAATRSYLLLLVTACWCSRPGEDSGKHVNKIERKMGENTANIGKRKRKLR